MVMAYLFLKAQGLAGVEVSDISIDANNKNLLSHRNCKVSKLKKEGPSLSGWILSTLQKVNVESFFCSSRLICTIG